MEVTSNSIKKIYVEGGHRYFSGKDLSLNTNICDHDNMSVNGLTAQNDFCLLKSLSVILRKTFQRKHLLDCLYDGSQDGKRLS